MKSDILSSDFKLYHKAIVMKRIKYWNKKRYKDEWIKIEI